MAAPGTKRSKSPARWGITIASALAGAVFWGAIVTATPSASGQIISTDAAASATTAGQASTNRMATISTNQSSTAQLRTRAS
ncbi:MAG TPA: hypothetical protein VMW62_15925 [Chloroflexota bacterium]|nr:hypothetical protein [Chloroflexota bacterium]